MRRCESSLDLHGCELARQDIGGWLLSVTRYDSRSSICLHGHEAAYATVVVRGGYEEVSGGSSLQCVAGSIVVHAAGSRHANRFAERTTCLNVHGGVFDRTSVIPASIAAAIASKLRREFARPDDVSGQIVEALMMELGAWSRRGPIDDRAPRWLREVRRNLESRFDEPLTLTTLATGAGVHPTHLARTFRHHYAMTVGEMLRERRVAHAKKQLAAGGAPSDVACQSGFADQSHFTRVFRRVTGTTPAVFRRESLAR